MTLGGFVSVIVVSKNRTLAVLVSLGVTFRELQNFTDICEVWDAEVDNGTLEPLSIAEASDWEVSFDIDIEVCCQTDDSCSSTSGRIVDV